MPHLLYASIVALAPALDSYATELASRLSKRWERAVFPAAALFVAAGIFELRGPKDVFAHVPIVAANFVKTHPPEGNLLNDYYAGGFLLYVWEGHPKVFIDLSHDGQGKCPYCGTVYKLKAGEHLHSH